MRTDPDSVDAGEVAKFERLASEWWNPDSKFKPLHKFNPVRLGYIRERMAAHFGRDARSMRPFEGLRVLDIGCGGGLLCEPMARLGADVVGVDPAPANISVAKLHAEKSGVTVDYRASTAEALSEAGERFDAILAMEVVEHVADLNAFIGACATMLRPSGLMFVATINRTMKAFALAIVGAEIVLRWLPRGTHEYDRLVRPAELEAALAGAGLKLRDATGVSYSPLGDAWRRSGDMDVNYVVVAENPAGGAGGRPKPIGPRNQKTGTVSATESPSAP